MLRNSNAQFFSHSLIFHKPQQHPIIKKSHILKLWWRNNLFWEQKCKQREKITEFWNFFTFICDCLHFYLVTLWVSDNDTRRPSKMWMKWMFLFSLLTFGIFGVFFSDWRLLTCSLSISRSFLITISLIFDIKLQLFIIDPQNPHESQLNSHKMIFSLLSLSHTTHVYFFCYPWNIFRALCRYAHETSCGHVQSQNEKNFLIKFWATNPRNSREQHKATRSLVSWTNRKWSKVVFITDGIHTQSICVSVCASEREA